MGTDSRPGAAPAPAGPWVVEVKIAGCTIRRRTTRRRNLIGLGDRPPPIGDLRPAGRA